MNKVLKILTAALAVGLLSVACGGEDETDSAPDLSGIVADAKQQAGTTTHVVVPAQHPVESTAKPPAQAKRIATPASVPTETPTAVATVQQSSVQRAQAQVPAPTPVLQPLSPAPALPETVNGLARRMSGEGYKATFSAGEAVVGAIIEVNGLKSPNCYVPSASAPGTVVSGAVNPFPDELLPECTIWVADLESINGLSRREGGSFSAGEAVSGYFKMDRWFYTNCFIRNAPIGGTIVDGVANPRQGELASLECNLDTVNGMPRREGGKFKAGEAVTGFTIMNGTKSPNNCYMQSAPYDGEINPEAGGVVNPWKTELAPPC